MHKWLPQPSAGAPTVPVLPSPSPAPHRDNECEPNRELLGRKKSADNDGAALMESATHHISLTCRPPLDQKQESSFVLIFETRKSVEIKAPTERKFPWSRCPQEKSRPARFSREKPTAKKTYER